jgi:hypothetical protein
VVWWQVTKDVAVALVPPTTKEPPIIKDYGKLSLIRPLDANGVYKPADEVFTFETQVFIAQIESGNLMEDRRNQC